MPAKVKVRILAGRNLPVMDKSSDASDAFVEVKLANTTYKTEVYRRSLNPFWNSEWFRFEVSDQELQDEPLQVRIMDYDTYSANDAIGKVYINLNPLLVTPSKSMSGWLPIYDTLHGIRGEINCMVKLNIFADNNRFRQSSCGVRFFFSDIPNGYRCDAILGFVDELLVNDDPEYQWIDKIRTPRASNEARQTLFTKLSGEVQRKLGLKAEILGGNAVIGYQQSFDLEGGSGIVGRGIGTAVVLSRIGSNNSYNDGIEAPVDNPNDLFVYNSSSNNNNDNNIASETNRHQSQFSYAQRGNKKSSQQQPHGHLVTGGQSHRHTKLSSTIESSPSSLVHSISADYFYEVPTLNHSHRKDTTSQTQASCSSSATEANASNLIANSMTMDNFDHYRSLDADETSSSSSSSSSGSPSESRTISSVVKVTNLMDLGNLTDDDDGDLDPISIRGLSGAQQLGATTSSRFVNSRFFNSMRAPKLSLAFRDANFKKISHKMSAHEIFRKFYHHNSGSNSSSHHLNAISPNQSSSAVTFRPTNISQTNKQLTKLLSQTKHHLIGANSSSQQHKEKTANNSRSHSRFKKERDHQQLDFDGQNSFMINSQSSNDEISGLVGKLTSAAPSSGSPVRGRDKEAEQDTCGLSVIEERLDDSDSGQEHREPQAAGKNTKRCMERAKEIDMADGDQEAATTTTSDNEEEVEDEDGEEDDDDNEHDVQGENDDDTSASQASTIVGVKSLGDASSLTTAENSLAADSQLSVATLTEEATSSEATKTTKTIKQISSVSSGTSSSAHLVKSQSLASEPVKSPRTKNMLPKSNTQESISVKSNRQTTNNSGTISAVKRSESLKNTTNNNKINSTSSKPNLGVQKMNVSQQPPASLASSLAKSVGVMKVQQHLLQNLIRHQNQNLVPTSQDGGSSRVRSVFIYPNLGEHQSEYPFVTFKKFPDKMIRCTGGVVSVHSVKLLDHIINDEESETRDIWWTEIRKEISCHAKALNCNTIIGYRETSKVISDVCILSAYGTAAIMSPSPLDLLDQVDNYENNYTNHNSSHNKHHHHKHHHHHQHSHNQSIRSSSHQHHLQQATMDSSLKLPNCGTSPPPLHSFMPTQQQMAAASAHNNLNSSAPEPMENSTCEDLATSRVQSPAGESMASQPDNNNSGDTIRQQATRQNNNQHQQHQLLDCSFCHTPLICSDSANLLPNCSICKHAKVPEVLLLTIEPPANLHIVSKASLVQARVCRAKRDSHGEVGAKEIGEALPFLEYELHRQLFSKLKFKGLNCLFNLTVDISVGENMISGLATGSGCFVLGLAQPEAPKISGGKGIKTSKLLQIQRLIESTSLKNRNLLNMDEINAQLEAYHEERKQQLHNNSSCHLSSENSSTSRYGHKLSTTAGNSSSSQNSASKEIFRSGSSPASPSLLQKQPIEQTTSADLENAVTSNGARNLLADDNNIILEVDDTEDANIIALLIDSEIPEGYVVCNSESLPLIDQLSITNLNMFTQVMRAKLTGLDQFGHLFDWILQALFVKLRRSLPCCLTNVTYAVDLPESNVVQVTISGCLLAMQQQQNSSEHIATLEDSAAQTTTTSRNDEITVGIVQSPSQNSMGSNGTSTSTTTTATSSKSTSSAASKQQQQHNHKSNSVKKRKQNTSTSASPRTSSSVSSSSESLHSSSSASDPRLSATKNSADSSNKQQGNKKSQSNSNVVGAKLLAKGSSLLSASKSSILGNKNKQQQQQSDREHQSIELSERNTIINKLDDVNHNDNDQSENELNQQRGSSSSSQLIRTVFKKQSTFPGAISPALSGQDPKMGPFSGVPSESNAGKVASGAARRATNLLNKVKQPLKDLGAASSSSSNHQHPSSGPNSKQQLQHSASASTALAGLRPSSSRGQIHQQASSSKNVASSMTQPDQSTHHHYQQQQQQQQSSSSNQHDTSFGLQRHHQQHLQLQQHRNQRHHSSPTNSSSQSGNSNAIDITSLSYIPGAKEYHYLGNLSFSFVRETGSVRENGGLNGFIHCFLMEVFAIVRAHVSALGGNALLSLRLQQSCIWYHSNKNQAQCLISVAGDAVQVVY